MSGKLTAAISSDIDTLESIYKGVGCRRQQGYTYAELRMGFENFNSFLQSYGVQSTLFMTGNDFKNPANHAAIRTMMESGHEIANHSMSHPQGFRLLSTEQKESEIAAMENACLQVTGKRPVGFRSPGWNIGDDTLQILINRGYAYDSSVFPTSLMPLLKALHWLSMHGREKFDRSTMGHWKYMLAPAKPYRTNKKSLAKKGVDGIVEFPITVSPLLRLPFFATFLLSTGLILFRTLYRMIKGSGRSLQFQFHLSDFVDYSHPDLRDQIPSASDGVYVPKALNTQLEQKIGIFRQAMDIIAEDYNFITLEDWARQIP